MQDSEASTKLRELLQRHERVALTGPANSGKTTLSLDVRTRPVMHLDEFVVGKHALPNERQSEAIVAAAASVWGPLLVEGVNVPRAIRKGMRVDALLILQDVHEEQSPGHERQAKGLQTVIEDCYAQGCLEGVEVVWA